MKAWVVSLAMMLAFSPSTLSQTVTPPSGADLEWWGGKFQVRLEPIGEDTPPAMIRIIVRNEYDHEIRVLSYDIQVVKANLSQAYTPKGQRKAVERRLLPGQEAEFALDLTTWPLRSLKGEDAGSASAVARGIEPDQLELSVSVEYWSQHYFPSGSKATQMATLGPWARDAKNKWVVRRQLPVRSGK